MAPCKRSVLITGVSTGIGHAATRAALARGWRVFGTLRQPTQAQALAADFGPHFHSLLLDVVDATAVHRAAAEVAEALGTQRLDGLINNAGIAVAGPLLHLPIKEIRRQLEVNLIAPLQIIQAFAPLLGSDPARQGPPGRIVNISSVSGKMGYPFVGAYAASKHALEGASESLRRELMLYGIDVILYSPGAIRTPIWGKSDVSVFASTPYGGILKRMEEAMRASASEGLAPEDVGRELMEILSCAQPRTRYAPVPNKWMSWTLPRLLPPRWLDRIIAKRLGLT
jgi:NAD(P)-dependent dehydrogenase (short-subunit alcohol dehydrogenase family)